MKSKLLALLSVALFSGWTAAHATPIIQTYDITGSNFSLSSGAGSPAPTDPLSINLTVSFDNAADIAGTTAGLTVNSFNLGYAVEYAYNAISDLMVIATSAATSGCGNPLNSFCIFINSVSTAPDVYFVQQSTSSGGYWTAQTIDATVNTSSVPEPATCALLGFGLLAFGLRHGRARAA